MEIAATEPHGNRGNSMIRSVSGVLAAFGLACAGLASLAPAQAADLPAKAPAAAPAVLSPSAWQFRATLYGWATGINGDVGVGRLPTANVDVTFHDILENLTGAFMGNFVASNGQFLFGADLVWSRLKDNVDFNVADGPLSDRLAGVVAKFQQNMTIASGVAGYRIPVGPPELELYGTVGLRYQNIKVKIDTTRNDPRFDRSASATQDWIDPIVGLAMNYRINAKWYIDAAADIGGFSVGSNLTSQGLIAVGYYWTPTISTALGYRALYTDYKNNNANGGSFRYETTIHGPYATLSVHF